MATIKIFIASSAEVKQERDRAILVIEHLNESHKHLELKAVEWEYATIPGNQPGFKNVQGAINPRLEESQMTVFILYSKIGKYTREEYEYATGNSKKLFAFFKTGFSPTKKEHIKSIEELIEFKESLNDTVLYKDYEDVEVFAKNLYESLNQFLADKYPASEVITTNEVVTVLSKNIQELIQMNSEKDKEIKELRERTASKTSDQYDDQLQKLLAEKEAITNELLKSEEIRNQQEKVKEELESQLTLQKDRDAFKAKALKAVEKKDYDAAENYLKESAKGSFSDAASTLYELANVKKLQFQYGEALNYYEMAIRLSPENSLYLNEAGVIADNIGFYDEAIEFYEKALVIDKKFYGEEYPSIAVRYNNLGVVYSRKGEYDKAIEFYEKALVIHKTFLGEEHPDIASGYNNLGSAYNSKGEYNKAIEFLEKALTISKKIHKEEHHDMATKYYNLGFIYNNKGEYDKAIELYEKALAIDKKFQGEDHPDIASDYNSLGLAYKYKGEHDKAIEFYEKALEIDKKIFGEEHPNIASDYNNLGSAYYSKNEYDKAVEFLKKALLIDKKFLGEEHPDIAIRYNNLGGAYYSKGENNKAIEFLEKALTIDKKFFGEEHPNIALRYNNLGMFYQSKEEYDKAIEFYERALSIGNKFLTPNHPNILTYQENLASAQAALANQKKKKPGE